MKSFLDIAIEYRRRGFSPIPIKPRDKRPLIAWEQFQKMPADEPELEQWGKEFQGANVGIVTGVVSGLVVIDIDSDAAKEKLKTLLGEYALDEVPRTRTGKGWQLFFKHPGTPIQNRAGVFPGLDVRCDGGYVVAPPSIHPNGKTYHWEVPLRDELPELPVALFELITQPPEQQYRARFNTAEALSGVEEGRRDETVFKLASKLRSADVPRDMAVSLILEAAKNCVPPFPETIALEKVVRAYAKYRPSGNGATEPKFWPEFLTPKEILSAPQDPTRWLWENVLPKGGSSMNIGKPKVAKTTFAANLSLAVARGLPFLGRATQKRAVAYLSLDASLPEIAEVFARFGLREDDQIFLHAGAAPKDAIGWLMERVKQNNVGLVIIDTLQRLFRFRNINDYSEVTNAMEPLLEAAREEKVHVMFLHHAKKDSQDDLDSAVGSTALRGLAYTYLHLKKLPNSERRILRTDQRGGKSFPETAIGFNRLTGWLEIQGSMEDAEIDEAIPVVIQALSAEDGALTEREIRKLVPLRGIIVSKAVRRMFTANDLERTGQGKRGNPFRYSLSVSLMADPSYSFLKRGIEKGDSRAEMAGHESEKQEKPLAAPTLIRVPEKRDTSGTRMGHGWDTNRKKDTSGHESDGLEKLLNEGWEVI